ncbi:ATP-binding protein [Kineococcus glutinatus]|uniref:ATP-binding protein n=1 Tax=Kineococcus glutinatus TaxID=1070872 RepID=A0ABP9HGC2_9ACTN
MATAAQVKALVESHGTGDGARFNAVALEVADSAARSGRTRYADELRDLVENAGTGARPPSTPAGAAAVLQPRGELARVLTVEQPTARLTDMALSAEVLRRVQRVLAEQRRQETLRAHGFRPLRKLILAGPAGTGKTMTAAVLAGELQLPLLSVRLDALADAPAEEAADRLRLVFDLMGQARGVYLFDDVDVLVQTTAEGAAGGRPTGLLCTFLTFVDEDASPSPLVVTTNRQQLLDRNVLRRFDALVQYLLPSTGVVHEIVQGRLRTFDLTAVEWPRIASTASGLSHEEITAAADLAAKQSLLEGREHVETAALLAALRERRELLKLAP